MKPQKNGFKIFFTRIILPTLLTICLFILTIFFIILPQFKENIMNGKREMIKELTNSAWSILTKYENDEKKGLLSREEAQKTAISRIQYLRYGEDNKDYFWITDLYPVMIMHPYRSDLNGKDLTNFSDPHGKKLFVEFVNTVKKREHGYVDYMWQWKDDSLHIVPKLSFVKLFKPWHWVIGTGIYIEDVKKEIDTLTKKLFWISVSISFLIAFLLFIIFQQSLRIERKRIEVENELKESKDKYKTLVEAATEGLIMLIEGKISLSNKIISKITGYENSELINLSLYELISENNTKDIIQAFSKNIVKEGQYELSLKRKTGGSIKVFITSSSIVLYNQTVNIIIVKDISTDRNSVLSDLDYQKLISSLHIGFFRARLDRKGKFMYANETAIKILGYSAFDVLKETHILEMLTNPEDRKNLRNVLIENGFLKNKVLEIRKKNNDSAIVSVSLLISNSEDTENLICDGIIEDITLQENEKKETRKMISELKSATFLIEQSIKNFIIPFHSIKSDSTIQDAIYILSKRKTDCVILTMNKNDYIGIITNSDIQQRVLQLNLQTDNPAYLIMSSPIIFINENSSVLDAITISDEKNIQHLVVKKESGEISGVIRMKDIHNRFKDSLSLFISNIGKTETTEELRHYYKRLQLFIRPLITSEISVRHITNITSSFSDAVTKRIIELVIKDMGKPPVRFSFIAMGSEGRREETLLTDQDNAILYEDVPKEKAEEVHDYFIQLGEKICHSLNYIGYSFCIGNIMARNSRWCQPISIWEKYFFNWITTPDPQNLLDAIIFFDFRKIYGDDELTERLTNTISNLIQTNPSFIYHLAFNTYNTKPPQIYQSNTFSDKNTEVVDLKNAVNLLMMFVRTYSLHYNIRCTNTLDRLNALNNRNIINPSSFDEIVFIYNFLMKLRLRNQIDLSDNNLPLSNILSIKKLIEMEISFLKKILSTIPTYQNKISTDFRIQN